MLSEKNDEMLEACWKLNESKNLSIESLKKLCAAEFSEITLKKLENDGLIVIHADKFVISQKGKSAAEGIIRRSRLAKVLVASILKLKQSEMEEIAHKIEHTLLPEVEEAVCTLLGHPGICPEGRMIPPGNCCQNRVKSVGRVVLALSELSAGESGKITHIKPDNHLIFQQLLSIGLRPGVLVTVLRKFPAFCVRFEHAEVAIDERVARNVFVWRLNKDDPDEPLENL